MATLYIPSHFLNPKLYPYVYVVEYNGIFTIGRTTNLNDALTGHKFVRAWKTLYPTELEYSLRAFVSQVCTEEGLFLSKEKFDKFTKQFCIPLVKQKMGWKLSKFDTKYLNELEVLLNGL
ncbi:hypothetical protein F7734_17370 [Scytonema sp. UIC 10036]|uniref:hypothetical protein n=1 Tax=Scytonema sp. UIC 10036 TaxID=2304196 RepID=UPI0012DAAD88|nr:hypothetical protein [Scytonema sp. UIC 10036]MUG94063.1 hypothetical protein [Scytonema sp. UIC 10036]